MAGEASNGGRRVADVLRRAADDLETVLNDAAAAHRRYATAMERESSWRSLDTAVTSQLRQRRTEVAIRAARLLSGILREEAHDADQRLRGLTISGAMSPPSPADDEPATVAAWWAGLTDEDRDLVLRDRGPWVGRADGLPAAVRHAANTRHLHRVLDSPSAHLHLGEEDIRGLRRLAELDEEEGGLLYLLDTRSSPIRAAVLVGDLDAASNVVVQVPGATTTVAHRLDRELAWVQAIREEAARAGAEAGGVVVLDWIGYHTPHDIAVRRELGDSGLRWLMPGQAVDDRYAREGAPALQQCLRGVRAIAPEGARLVASGHSYGGSVIGLALQTCEQPLVNAVVVTGCPGLFVTSVEELHVPDNAVFAFVAAGDLIARLGMFGVETAKVDGIHLLSPITRVVSDADGSRRWLRPPVGHEDYYSPGTTSLAAVAGVALGLPARIKTVPWAWLMKHIGRGGAGAGGELDPAASVYPPDHEPRVD